MHACIIFTAGIGKFEQRKREVPFSRGSLHVKNGAELLIFYFKFRQSLIAKETVEVTIISKQDIHERAKNIEYMRKCIKFLNETVIPHRSSPTQKRSVLLNFK